MAATSMLEESYLHHILIAVEAGDLSAPYRTFFDSWFAFRLGGPFLNSNSRPQWYNNPCPEKHGEALRRAHFVSVAAARTLSGIERERLMKDHAIPVSVLRDLLLGAQPSSINEVRSLMERFYRIGIITRPEDDALCAAKLRSRMPVGWDAKSDPFARYHACDIIAQGISGSDQAVRKTQPKVTRPSSVSGLPARLLNTALSGLAWKGVRHD